MRLKGKVAIVTGASSDIGKGISKKFIQEGATVILLARNLEGLEKARKELGNEKSTVSISCAAFAAACSDRNFLISLRIL